MNPERENQPLRSPPHNLTLLPSQFTRMSQETVRFSSSAWRAVGATIASQGSQGQASPVQEEAPAASLTAATNSADSFLDSFLQEAERDAVGVAIRDSVRIEQ